MDAHTLTPLEQPTAPLVLRQVVALTASVMSEEVARLKRRGFDGAIAKPLNVEAFPDLIARIMEGESVWYIV